MFYSTPHDLDLATEPNYENLLTGGTFHLHTSSFQGMEPETEFFR